jgi:hypothetical protein
VSLYTGRVGPDPEHFILQWLSSPDMWGCYVY